MARHHQPEVREIHRQEAGKGIRIRMKFDTQHVQVSRMLTCHCSLKAAHSVLALYRNTASENRAGFRLSHELSFPDRTL